MCSHQLDISESNVLSGTSGTVETDPGKIRFVSDMMFFSVIAHISCFNRKSQTIFYIKSVGLDVQIQHCFKKNKYFDQKT